MKEKKKRGVGLVERVLAGPDTKEPAPSFKEWGWRNEFRDRVFSLLLLFFRVYYPTAGRTGLKEWSLFADTKQCQRFY